MFNFLAQRLWRAKTLLPGPFAICVMVSASAAALAQSPEFDAASIKPNTSGNCTHGCGLRFTPGLVSSLPGGVNVRQMILAAYQVSPYQLTGGPGWLDSDMFDLEARGNNSAGDGQLRLMFQTLLSRRCKLLAHHETREAPVYALTVGKNGLKLHEIKEGDPQPTQPEKFTSAAAALPGTPAPTLLFRSVKQFAAVSESNPLAGIGRPVVDKTGLAGQYFFAFTWDPKEDYMGAVEEQLGLKFVAEKAALDFYVVDHIERPDPN
jgi:uncharacterized protein (TIGR03435 family)